jgi:glycosyltransferase involved in cell wall biosynthesis
VSVIQEERNDLVPVADPVDGRTPSVTVVVPTFNNSSHIVPTLQRLHEHIARLAAGYDIEIFVVDDASTDGTPELVEAFTSDHPGTRLLRHYVPFTMGAALRTAFEASDADYVIVIDADMTYGPEHVERLLETIGSTHARVVIASPDMPGGSTTGVRRLRRHTRRSANRLLSLVASGRLHTLNSMVRAYDGPFLRGLNLKAMGEEVNTEIIYKAQLLRAVILEVPAHVDESRRHSTVRRSPYRVVTSAIRSFVPAFLFRPFAFFIAPGVILLAAGVTARMVWGRGNGSPFGGQVESEITAVVGATMIFLGILTLQAKRYFEEAFHLATTVLREVRKRDR